MDSTLIPASKIGLSVVVYKPDEACLRSLLSRIAALNGTGFRVAVFLNSREERAVLSGVIISHAADYRNMGLGAAHNENIDRLLELGCEYIMTLDQDTNISEACVRALCDALEILPPLSATGPRLQDKNGAPMLSRFEKLKRIFLRSAPPAESLTEVKMLIQSGLMFRAVDWESVGKFDETLFVGEVDYEFCYRLRGVGGRCFRHNWASIRQSIGLGRAGIPLFTVALHRPLRHYYYIRNQIRLVREKRYPFSRVPFIIAHAIAVVLLSPLAGREFICTREVVQGIVDGWNMHGGEKGGAAIPGRGAVRA